MYEEDWDENAGSQMALEQRVSWFKKKALWKQEGSWYSSKAQQLWHNPKQNPASSQLLQYFASVDKNTGILISFNVFLLSTGYGRIRTGFKRSLNVWLHGQRKAIMWLFLHSEMAGALAVQIAANNPCCVHLSWDFTWIAFSTNGCWSWSNSYKSLWPS